MRIFLYEFLTGGGCWSMGSDPPGGTIHAEGKAMRDALAHDFAAVPEVESIVLLHDVRLPDPQLPKQELLAVRSAAEEQGLVREASGSADATLLIAPEFGELLASRARWAEAVNARLISPGSEFIALASNKQQAAEHLAARGIRVPKGFSFAVAPPELPQDFFPAVLKPVDGAGSLLVNLVQSPDELLRLASSAVPRWRVERFVPGQAVSVAVVAGPHGTIALPACEQRLSSDGEFTYLGGRTPIHRDRAERAERLALTAASALPGIRGYVGFDLVLGGSDDGTQDFVMEVNPRLTTSYIGLRHHVRENLAMLLWAAARGEAVGYSCRPNRVEFTADGIIQVQNSTV